jgi:hypothetical protein
LFIFIGAGWTLVYFLLSRLFLHFAIGGKFRLFTKNKDVFSIIANPEESERIKGLLSQMNINNSNIIIYPPKMETQPCVSQLIFSAYDLSYKSIISKMVDWGKSGLDFKIAPPDSTILIGSNSIDTAGDLYVFNNNAIGTKENQRKKRIFDILLAIALFLSVPISIFRYMNKTKNGHNLVSVFLWEKSFVGFTDTDMKTAMRLPKMREGLLSPANMIELDTPGIREKLNILYTRDYSMRKDLSIVIKLSRNLDT